MVSQVFTRDEHEFLRLVAPARPNWERLRQLIQEDMDWQYLRHVAEQHQLDGVLAWRCADAQLDGACPETVSEDCRRYLVRLNVLRQAWAEDVALVAEALDAAGVTWGVFGFPATYLPYGMSPQAWPRESHHVDVLAPGEQYDAFAAALAPLGFRPDSSDLAPGFILPQGTRVNPGCTPTWYGRDLPQRFAEIPETFVGARREDLYGASVPVLRPEVALVLRASFCFLSVFTPAPIPLGELAHVHNLATASGALDWKITLAYLRILRERAARTRAALGRASAAKRARLRHAKYLRAQWRNFSPLAWCLWVWDLTDRLYGTFPADVLSTAHSLLGAKLDPLCWTSVGEPDTWPLALVRWKAWPGDERMLFDLYDRWRLSERLEDSVWEVVGGQGNLPEWTVIPVEFSDGFLPD